MKINFNNILCATDLSDLSTIAISSGVALAKEFNAKLYVCHIVDLSTTAAYGDIIFAPLELQNKTIGYTHEQLKRMMQNQSIDWEPLVTAGHPPDEISKFVAMHRIDLVVSATHGRSGLKRVFLGSVTERLIRILPCPLLIVRSHEDIDTFLGGFSLGFKKILVGCDFSTFSELAFQYGLSLAQDFESELHLVHVIETTIARAYSKSGAAPGGSPEKTLYHQLSEKLSKMIPEESVLWCRRRNDPSGGQALRRNYQIFPVKFNRSHHSRHPRAQPHRGAYDGLDHRPGFPPGPLPGSVGLSDTRITFPSIATVL